MRGQQGALSARPGASAPLERRTMTTPDQTAPFSIIPAAAHLGWLTSRAVPSGSQPSCNRSAMPRVRHRSGPRPQRPATWVRLEFVVVADRDRATFDKLDPKALNIRQSLGAQIGAVHVGDDPALAVGMHKRHGSRTLNSIRSITAGLGYTRWRGRTTLSCWALPGCGRDRCQIGVDPGRAETRFASFAVLQVGPPRRPLKRGRRDATGDC